MNESFIGYNDSAILNRLAEFPATLFRLKPVFLRTFWTSSSLKNDVTPSIVNVTMRYIIDDVMKFKLATEWRHAGPCCVREVIYQPINHWV